MGEPQRTQSNGKRRFRLGVMGGTFDPIHNGHLVAASEVASTFDLDEVVFVPTGDPWHKPAAQQVSPAEHRYLMTVIATASNPRFTVSRVDIDRPGPTYTIDTLRDLKTARPEADLFFITGADAMAQILSWKDIQELWSLARFVGVTRPGHVLENVGRDDVFLLDVPAMAISSTDCRRRVAEGNPVWYLVPDGVVQYIAKHRLYAADRQAPNSAETETEPVA
ncbi:MULTISPECIES: nicotinate-nucleotide adenylyltransferase [unclassified Arthrobacter]|uniref:nicotinate-nucleotide adenylyltransferase n=1 Tax=unclassified Arthrobacter TaxID=235627 RepID=UPI002102B904|nr:MULTISPECIES: nicotinate-nucleotide adenylyltransferase [unclassified Arthrobacter]UWX80704.1 nicotinate-nucleotide adenylyltransferase [Arthrobacter sp. zg-Y1171]